MAWPDKSSPSHQSLERPAYGIRSVKRTLHVLEGRGQRGDALLPSTFRTETEQDPSDLTKLLSLWSDPRSPGEIIFWSLFFIGVLQESDREMQIECNMWQFLQYQVPDQVKAQN